MSDLNDVKLIGCLGADPELRSLSSGTAVCKMRLATGKKWKDKNTDELKEQTQWHTITVFGKQGENCAQYLEKGRQIFVSGELRYSEVGEGDERKYFTEIVADNVIFLGSGGGGGSGEASEEPKAKRMKKDEDISF